MGEILWKPDPERVKNTNMYRFMQRINEKYGKDFSEYEGLWNWSVDNIPEFWAEMWDVADVKVSRPYKDVVDDPAKMPGAKWFSGARMNFAENLLRFRDDLPAIVFYGEGQEPVRLTYEELFLKVAALAAALKKAGVEPLDRVAGFMPNMPETIIAMLAATSLGAIWSSCSPDFGQKGVLDRFGQIRPKILFCADGYRFKGKEFDSLEKIAGVVQTLPTLQQVVVVPYTRDKADISKVPASVHYDEFVGGESPRDMEFAQLPASHPLYIMYSSGTTGLPKCMIQSAGGILVNHLKELLLHTDVKRDDNIFYFTTCGWMMWNWLISSLAAGATVVLYDGSPFHPDPGALWRMAADEKLTVFGTSAGYLSALSSSGYVPKGEVNLENLRALLSTGSPLSKEGFRWVYENVKDDLQLSSISGGTDLNGCFALGNPMGPVYEGELQCRGLAMAVEAWDDNGEPVINQKGELVCTKPFPSMPAFFWDDPEGEKYHKAYFDVYPGVWRHGDFIEINDHGGVVIYGRSDATLNPGGVRIGTAEIYRVVEGFDEIADSVVVGQSFDNDERVVLFVKLAEGAELTEDLAGRIREAIRENASPRHVPAKILPVPDVPYTLNMKKVELAVKKVIEGKEVPNADALANPEVLAYYRDIPELKT
ncbi:MAG: acetoacetate--CoA ligase [Deltaproteobacteria bacterium]|nr:acetoacetate--CoA ligase [Deltaproteobacteria bacterium]